MHGTNAFARSKHRTRLHGFTLVEQIMVIAILAVLASVAAPSLNSVLKRSQVRTGQQDLIVSLNHARNRAITANTSTILCPTVDGARCIDADVWDSGWLLAHDADRDNQPDGDPLQVVLRPQRDMRLRSTAGRRRVRFQSDGSAGGSNVTVIICTAGDSANALVAVVSVAGRIRGTKATAEQASVCE